MPGIPAWYSPEKTIWRSHPNPQDAYRRLIASGVTEIMREVRAKLPGVGLPLSTTDPTLYDADTLWALAGQADREFIILRSCGIDVPEVKWHVPEHEGTSRLVACVDAVHGYDLYEVGHGSPTHAEFERNRDAYYASPEPGARLNEINARQCIAIPLGAALQLGNVLQLDRTCMVDIEPIF